MKKLNLLIGSILLTVSFPLAAVSSSIYDGGTFYTDVPSAQSSLLGAAQYFHIFANQVYLRSHTDGNIATRNLTGQNADFGTSNYSSKEYNYVQIITSINSASFISGPNKNKFVVGNTITVDRSNSNRPKVNGTFLDHLTSSQVFQDDQTPYIDFDLEFARLRTVNTTLAGLSPDLVVNNSMFSDFNNRVIDISKINKSVVVVDISPDVLTMNTPLIFKGLEKGITGKKLLLNVKLPSGSSYTINSPIKLFYTDGTQRNPQQSGGDFSGSTFLWNFTQNDTLFSGLLTITAPWQGTILAPNAKLDGTGVNIDGSIIVDTFLGAGETHRWDLVYGATITPTNIVISDSSSSSTNSTSEISSTSESSIENSQSSSSVSDSSSDSVSSSSTSDDSTTENSESSSSSSESSSDSSTTFSDSISGGADSTTSESSSEPTSSSSTSNDSTTENSESSSSSFESSSDSSTTFSDSISGVADSTTSESTSSSSTSDDSTAENSESSSSSSEPSSDSSTTFSDSISGVADSTTSESSSESISSSSTSASPISEVIDSSSTSSSSSSDNSSTTNTSEGSSSSISSSNSNSSTLNPSSTTSKVATSNSTTSDSNKNTSSEKQLPGLGSKRSILLTIGVTQLLLAFYLIFTKKRN
ncbi:collagen-binding domain-containing protein [Enterococcus sp. 5H]|uniref:collagen-binding domain-containing protein n=1 Tax=Enterococcus sp. 5H TaxID=1229490 RepID=UPI002303EC9E|nr:collagen-binding domain-containing protein [Enterococcus sp. 5H]MDA9471207.1 hypothetical protein [Enterococcus sp. 5H]